MNISARRLCAISVAYDIVRQSQKNESDLVTSANLLMSSPEITRFTTKDCFFFTHKVLLG